MKKRKTKMNTEVLQTLGRLMSRSRIMVSRMSKFKKKKKEKDSVHLT
jgi:hypothetical protein